MVDELQTALFRPWIKYPRPCDRCRAGACDLPHVVTPKGEFLRLARDRAPAGSVSWDRCPYAHETLFVHGIEVLDIADVLAWAYERGVHRHPLLSAGAEWLMRSWLRLRAAADALAARPKGATP